MSQKKRRRSIDPLTADSIHAALAACDLPAVLGVDASTTAIGYHFQPGRHGGVDGPQGDDVGGVFAGVGDTPRARLASFRRDVWPLFARTLVGPLKPDLVAIEEPPQVQNVRTLQDLCAVRSMVIEAAARHRIPTVDVHPSSWRSVLFACATFADGEKKPTVRPAIKRLSINTAAARIGRPIAEDEADAYWCAMRAQVERAGQLFTKGAA